MLRSGLHSRAENLPAGFLSLAVRARAVSAREALAGFRESEAGFAWALAELIPELAPDLVEPALRLTLGQFDEGFGR